MAEPAPRALASRFRWRPGWDAGGQAATAVLLVLLVGYPLLQLVRTALADGAGAAATTVTSGGTGRAVINTLWTSLAITGLAVAGGTAAAVVVERSGVPGRRWLRTAMIASLLTAPLVSALGWARAYGEGGLLDRMVGLSWPGLYGPAGIVAVGTAGAVPLGYLVVAAGLASRAEPDMERAARISGATAWQATRTVTLPLSRPAVGAAAALIFVTTVISFEVPAVLGIPAGFPTMTTRLYQNLTLSADPGAFTSAAVLAVGLVILSMAVVAPSDALTGVGRADRTSSASGAPGSAGPAAKRLAAGLWTFLLFTAAVPLLALVLVAVTKGVGVTPVPAHWTLDNFQAVLDGHTSAALGNSVLLAGAAATFVVLLGGLSAALSRRRVGRALGTLVTASFAVAGSALAVAVLLAYGRFLRDTLVIILVAYLAKFWALGHRPLAGAAERIPADLVRAGRVSGAGAASTVWTVIAPLMRPAVAGGWLLVFLFAVHELTISSLLYGPGDETLAVVILNRQELGDVSATSALSVLLTLLIAAAGLLLLLVRRVAVRRMEGL